MSDQVQYKKFKNRSTKKIINKTLFYILIVGIVLFMMTPVYFLLVTSFMSDQEAYDWPLSMFPSIFNDFIMEKSNTIDGGYLISIYSDAQQEYVTLSESDDFEYIQKFIRGKTNSQLEKEIFDEKVKILDELNAKNGNLINELSEKLSEEEIRLAKMNRDLIKIEKQISKIPDDMSDMQDIKNKLIHDANDIKAELIRSELAVKNLKNELRPINSVKFSIVKNWLDNFDTLFRVTRDSVDALLRSIQVALTTVFISLLIGGMAGYAFARYFFKGKNLLKLSVLFVRMFPAIAVAMPMVIILAEMGFYDQPIGLSFVYSVGQIAMTIWITASIFMSIPVELEEAAQVFGTSRVGAFIKVTLPLALPGLAASAMYAFIGSWNETAQAIVLTQHNPTFPVVIYQTLVGTKGMINLVAAGGVAMALPAVIFTLIIRKYILQMWGGVTV